MCVSVRERKGEREGEVQSVGHTARGSSPAEPERERECVCVFLCLRESECVCERECVSVRARGREGRPPQTQRESV